MHSGRCHVSVGCRRGRILAWGCGLLGAFASFVLMTGCAPPYNDVLVNDQGEQVRVEGVQKILSDDTLTEQEKREGLMRYGITDETMLDALLRL